MSVSTLTSGRGAATPVRVVNFSIAVQDLLDGHPPVGPGRRCRIIENPAERSKPCCCPAGCRASAGCPRQVGLSHSCIWGFFRKALTGTSRSEEHTSELQSLMRISYAVFCLKKKKKH